MLNKVLNGRYTAVFISTVLHIVLLIVLIYLSADTKIPVEKPISKPAIKSYIYTPPVQPSLKPIAPPLSKEKVIKVIEEPVVPKKVEKKLVKDSALPKNTKKPIVKPEEKDEQKLLPGPPLPGLDAKPKNSLPTTSNRKFSAHEQLSRLRSSINNRVVNDAYKEHTQIRSASAMDGEQIPVPHSTKQLTPEEVYEKNTSSTGHNKITKNDNGTCTIRREQMLGSPVEATTSSFACGESQFDKNFREHMKKVRDKVMPNKR